MLNRLALCCALLLPGVSGADDTATLAQCAAVEDATVRLACYDALAHRPSTPGAPAAPVAPAMPVAPAAAAPDTFGMQVLRDDASIDTRIVGSFITWKHGTLFKLDNGQVWRVIDDYTGYYPDLPENPEVTITQGMSGYRMTIKAIRKKVGVKRVS